MPDKDKTFSSIVMEGIMGSRVTLIDNAIRNHTPLIIWQDGKIVEVPPEALITDKGK